MKPFVNRSLITVLFAVLLISSGMSCGMRPFGRPHGKVIGSCKGSMRLTSGGKVRFVFDIIHRDEGEIGFFLSIPRKGVRYMPVEDISFDDGIVHIEGKSPGREFEGTLIGKGLSFEGQWENYKGSFTLDIDD